MSEIVTAEMREAYDLAQPHIVALEVIRKESGPVWAAYAAGVMVNGKTTFDQRWSIRRWMNRLAESEGNA